MVTAQQDSTSWLYILRAGYNVQEEVRPTICYLRMLERHNYPVVMGTQAEAESGAVLDDS